jgi:hypothetical protein
VGNVTCTHIFMPPAPTVSSSPCGAVANALVTVGIKSAVCVQFFIACFVPRCVLELRETVLGTVRRSSPARHGSLLLAARASTWHRCRHGRTVEGARMTTQSPNQVPVAWNESRHREGGACPQMRSQAHTLTWTAVAEPHGENPDNSLPRDMPGKRAPQGTCEPRRCRWDCNS